MATFLALLELCTLEGLKYERVNLALRQLHAISSFREHDMNNKSFHIQGHMDSVKNLQSFSGSRFFGTCILNMHTRHAYARKTCILGFGDTDLSCHLCVDVFSLTPSFFYKHIKHMATICIKFGDFPPCPLYICFGESPQCCLFVALCFSNKPGVLDLQSEHEFSTHIKPLRLIFTHWVHAFFVPCIQAAHSKLKWQKTASPSKRMKLCEGTCRSELIMWRLDADSSLVLWTQISDHIKRF